MAVGLVSVASAAAAPAAPAALPSCGSQLHEMRAYSTVDSCHLVDQGKSVRGASKGSQPSRFKSPCTT